MAMVEPIQDVGEIKKSVHATIKKITEVMTEFCYLVQTKRDNEDENTILQNVTDVLRLSDIELSSTHLKINLEILQRNKMKCAFIGKTSNGKSSVINAILNKKLLPSSTGRTTSCFIKIEDCDEDVGYLEDKDGKKGIINDLQDIANEVHQKSYGVDSQVTLFLPKKLFPLLNNEITLLDSPGVDYSEDHRKGIELFCQDADVFVFVVDACATINESEKMFFKSVKSVVASPNVIVLTNKWDICVNEIPESRLIKVKRQHENTVKNFFKEDLKIDCDVEDRIFFISSSEMLDRSNEGKEQMVDDFNKFVQVVKKEMSQSAVLRKFKPHLDKAKEGLDLIIEAIGTIEDMEDGNVIKELNEVEAVVVARIMDQLKIHFQELTMRLTENISKKSEILVASVSKKSKGFSQLDERINEFANNILSIFVQGKQTAIMNIVIAVRKALIDFSKIKINYLLLDKYLPRSQNDDKETDSASEISGTSFGDAVPADEAKSRNDDESAVAIVVPLTLNLGTIFSHEQLRRSEIKGLKDSLNLKNRENKESRKVELTKKVANATLSIVMRPVEQHKNEVMRLVNILIGKFIQDCNQCVELIRLIRPLRETCRSLEDDIEEMKKILSFGNC